MHDWYLIKRSKISIKQHDYTLKHEFIEAYIQCTQSQVALDKLNLQCTSAQKGFHDQFQLKQTDHQWASSAGSLHHHPHLHSH
jgi:hypothetical protein